MIVFLKFAGAVTLASDGERAGFFSDYYFGTEQPRGGYPMPMVGLVRSLYLTALDDGVTVPITVTVYKNGEPTTMQIVVPANADHGVVYCDLAHPFPILPGDQVALFISNPGQPDELAWHFNAIAEVTR